MPIITTLLTRIVWPVALCAVGASCAVTSEQTSYKGYAEINGFEMYYELHGDGQPVLLLHGGTLSGAASFSRVIPELKDEFALIVPDSRAHGRSTDTGEPLSYDQLTDDIVGLMDHLGIASAHVVGWSDGGVIGLNMGMRYPDRLRSLVTYGSNYHVDGLPPDAIEWARQLGPETFHPNLARLVYLDIAPEPERFGEMIEKVVSMWLVEPTWTTSDLGQITAPVLVLEDSLGLAIRPEHTRSMVEAIPQAEIAYIDDTNHQAPQEQTAEFVRLVRAFLRKQTEQEDAMSERDIDSKGILALEVSVNGELLYVAGAEDWGTLWTNVHAIRVTPEWFAEMAARAGTDQAEVATEPHMSFTLGASVAAGSRVWDVDSDRADGE